MVILQQQTDLKVDFRGPIFKRIRKEVEKFLPVRNYNREVSMRLGRKKELGRRAEYRDAYFAEHGEYPIQDFGP
eukprot:333995-Amphidinium_carterae.1